MSKHILLISYVFPPYPGIGGRRWAYHTAELAQRGYNVHIITAKNPFEQTSLYNDIIDQHPRNITIHRLPTLFPKVLIDFSTQSLWKKVWYKIALILVKLFAKGSYYDRSFFWKNSLLKKANSLIEEYRIKNVIVSGAPFSSVYYTTLLKKSNPNINIIADFRDPWTWAENWGYNTLESKRKLYEEFMEKEVVKNTDHVIVPVQNMVTYLSSKYPFARNKIALLPHFYVEQDIPILTKKESGIKMLFYGTVYDGIGHYLSFLSEAIQNTSITIDFFTESQSVSHYFNKNKNVNFYKTVPFKELFAQINEYNFILIINPDRVMNYISTKFYETIYSRTPIFYIANKGLASEFIVNNRLGIHADADSIFQKIEELKSYNTEKDYNSTFDVSNFSLEKVTNIVESLLV